MSDYPNNNCTLESQSPTQPNYTVIPNSEGVTVKIDLPGAKKEDISITSEKQQLKVTATRDTSSPESWSLLNQLERPNDYALTLNVHRDLDLSTASASNKNGVLSLHVKRRKESLPHQIEINN